MLKVTLAEQEGRGEGRGVADEVNVLIKSFHSPEALSSTQVKTTKSFHKFDTELDLHNIPV